MTFESVAFGLLAAVATASGGSVLLNDESTISVKIFVAAVGAVLSVGIWIGTKITSFSKDITYTNARLDALTKRLEGLPCTSPHRRHDEPCPGDTQKVHVVE